MSLTLASQTIARLQQALRTRDTASLPEVMKLIEELSSRAFSISVHELAELIGRDTIVTAKVIRSANTFGYNPGGIAVTTVSGAIQVVGFNKVRNLALSMLLLENAHHPAHSEAQRESAALALCSGLLAQALVAGRPEHDPEQAFVFACLRSYGRLLLTTHLADDWTKVAQRPAHETENDASRRVFGLTPLGITQQMFDTTRLPKPILRCLQDLPPGQLGQPANSPEDFLATVTQFSATLGELVLSPRVNASDFSVRSAKLCVQFGQRLDLDKESLRKLVGTIDQSLRAFQRTYGMHSVGAGVLQRLAARASAAPAEEEIPPELLGSVAKDAPPQPAAASSPGAPAAGTTGESSTGTTPADAGAATLTECLLQLTELMTASPIDLRQMETLTLTATKSALRLRDCVWFVRVGAVSGLAARGGSGDLLQTIRDRPLLGPEKRDVFGICLTRREDVLIRDTNDPKLRSFLPDWLTGAGPVGSFILLPLQDAHGVFALILGTRPPDDPLAPAPRELQLLKAIRQHLASARRLAAINS